ncbi:Bardet-Biedl syndrome 2 protein, partial [Kipferlia bialata]|eukprot:g11994.t1
MPALVPSFRLSLGTEVSGVACMGRFDGHALGIAAFCPGNNQVVVQTFPSTDSDDHSSGPFLEAFQQQDRVLHIGRLPSAGSQFGERERERQGEEGVSAETDLLLLSRPSEVCAYSVPDNASALDIPCDDGALVTCVCTGYDLGLEDEADHPMPMVVVGGNCSVVGHRASGEAQGEQVYWNIAGDEVTGMCVLRPEEGGMDIGTPYLVIATRDSFVRLYRGEEMVTEIPTPSIVTELTPITLPAQDDQEERRFLLCREASAVCLVDVLASGP